MDQNILNNIKLKPTDFTTKRPIVTPTNINLKPTNFTEERPIVTPKNIQEPVLKREETKLEKSNNIKKLTIDEKIQDAVDESGNLNEDSDEFKYLDGIIKLKDKNLIIKTTGHLGIEGRNETENYNNLLKYFERRINYIGKDSNQVMQSSTNTLFYKLMLNIKNPIENIQKIEKIETIDDRIKEAVRSRGYLQIGNLEDKLLTKLYETLNNDQLFEITDHLDITDEDGDPTKTYNNLTKYLEHREKYTNQIHNKEQIANIKKDIRFYKTLPINIIPNQPEFNNIDPIIEIKEKMLDVLPSNQKKILVNKFNNIERYLLTKIARKKNIDELKEKLRNDIHQVNDRLTYKLIKPYLEQIVKKKMDEKEREQNENILMEQNENEKKIFDRNNQMIEIKEKNKDIDKLIQNIRKDTSRVNDRLTDAFIDPYIEEIVKEIMNEREREQAENIQKEQNEHEKEIEIMNNFEGIINTINTIKSNELSGMSVEELVMLIPLLVKPLKRTYIFYNNHIKYNADNAKKLKIALNKDFNDLTVRQLLQCLYRDYGYPIKNSSLNDLLGYKT